MTDSYFVGMRSPEEMRKNVLNSSKDVITSLKRYEAYKSISALKLALMGDLKQTISEVGTLNSRLRRILPKTKIPAHAPVREAKEPRTTPREVPREKKTSKLDLLQEELAKIERKLGELE